MFVSKVSVPTGIRLSFRSMPQFAIGPSFMVSPKNGRIASHAISKLGPSVPLGRPPHANWRKRESTRARLAAASSTYRLSREAGVSSPPKLACSVLTRAVTTSLNRHRQRLHRHTEILQNVIPRGDELIFIACGVHPCSRDANIISVVSDPHVASLGPGPPHFPPARTP